MYRLVVVLIKRLPIVAVHVVESTNSHDSPQVCESVDDNGSVSVQPTDQTTDNIGALNLTPTMIEGAGQVPEPVRLPASAISPSDDASESLAGVVQTEGPPVRVITSSCPGAPHSPVLLNPLQSTMKLPENGAREGLRDNEPDDGDLEYLPAPVTVVRTAEGPTVSTSSKDGRQPVPSGGVKLRYNPRSNSARNLFLKDYLEANPDAAGDKEAFETAFKRLSPDERKGYDNARWAANTAAKEKRKLGELA